MVGAIFLTIVPMGYSCWSSLLNSTIHIAESKFHFTYTVGLGYYRYFDIPLVYSSSFSRTANLITLIGSLYPTFVVYLTTIYGRLSFIDWPKSIEGIIHSFKELQETFFLICFTKLRLFFHSVKYLVNFFLGSDTEYLSSPISSKPFTNICTYFWLVKLFFTNSTIIINMFIFLKRLDIYDKCVHFS